MEQRYYCHNRRRARLVAAHATLNGIDYLEVLDRDAPAGSPRQRTLLVRTLKSLPAPPASLDGLNVRIEGGVRVRSVSVMWAARAAEADDLLAAGLISVAERDFFAAMNSPESLLLVRTDSTGDFSSYTFRLVVSETDDNPPINFDLPLSSVEFSFKVECPTEFDCADDTSCPPERRTAPEIDYLAKDYNSFRQLMFDRLSILMPDWKERNPADMGVVMVELLAYVGDYLSYYQDAVATEAYLGTARRRVSVRRHARLLDYAMHDGCNARTWLAFQVTESGGSDNALLPKGTPFSTEPGRADEEPVVFETTYDITLRSAHNEIPFYTWGDGECCLPAGSVRATLKDDGLMLEEGDVLIFEEVISPTTGLPADADPARRCAVRLTAVERKTDPLNGAAVMEIRWHDGDALPFPLCVSALVPGESGSVEQAVSTARGNVVLADHGLSAGGELLSPATVPADGVYRPGLLLEGARVTMTEEYDAGETPSRSASELLLQDPRNALPAVRLVDGDDNWEPQRDLLASDRFATEFVLETETDGSAMLRFGDGTLGKAPAAGKTLLAACRTGNGAEGNVGRNTIVKGPANLTDLAVTNPLPGSGGTEPESIEEVRQFAPQAFRVQQRAVTEADYVRLAEQHPQVQKAAARFRWTGSWHTVFVTVDRIGGLPVDRDPEFEEEMRRWLDRFRVAGYDLEITGPVYVPLDIAVNVCVKPGYFRSDVKASLREAFSRFDLADGGRGFFHPDNFTFGQPLYLSRMYERAMRVEGVASVEVTRMQRWSKKPDGEIQAGMVSPAPLEIIQLDNDPSAPENGKIDFVMNGGL